METIVLLVALITLIVSLTTLCLVLYLLLQKNEITIPITNPLRKLKESVGKDSYTPDYADQTVPIEDFEPDFTRKINLKYKDETKEEPVGEETITPIQTDDLTNEE